MAIAQQSIRRRVQRKHIGTKTSRCQGNGENMSKGSRLLSTLLLVVLFGVGFTALPLAAMNGQQQYRPSPADCDAYARNYADQYASGMLGGAVRGGAGGALFGAIVGGSKGAKRGALLGGAVGGTRNVVNRNQVRKQAYNDCMAGRVRW